jgi:hypothetical protein
MLEPLPVFVVLEVKTQYRDNMRDIRSFQRSTPVEGDDTGEESAKDHVTDGTLELLEHQSSNTREQWDELPRREYRMESRRWDDT